MELLAKTYGFKDAQIESFYENYRPLGACSAYMLDELRGYTGGKLEELLKHIEIIPVPLTESLGTVTGKYAAKDKT